MGSKPSATEAKYNGKWSKSEEDLLELHCKDLTSREIGKMLGRTQHAVLAKAHRMGLEMTKESEYVGIRELSNMLGIGVGKIRKYIPKLQNKYVTRELYSMPEVVKAIESTPAIDMYAYKVGSLGGYETEKVLALHREAKKRYDGRMARNKAVKQDYNSGMPPRELSKKYGLSTGSIRRITENEKPQRHKWTSKEVADLKVMDVKPFCKKYGLSYSIVARKKHYLVNEGGTEHESEI